MWLTLGFALRARLRRFRIRCRDSCRAIADRASDGFGVGKAGSGSRADAAMRLDGGEKGEAFAVLPVGFGGHGGRGAWGGAGSLPKAGTVAVFRIPPLIFLPV